MGNTTPHVTQIRDILNRVAGNLRKLPKPDVETLVIEDPAQAVFELVRVGWHSGERIDNTVIFARVRDGKVWIEEDNTDLTFADELMRGAFRPRTSFLRFSLRIGVVSQDRGSKSMTAQAIHAEMSYLFTSQRGRG